MTCVGPVFCFRDASYCMFPPACSIQEVAVKYYSPPPGSHINVSFTSHLSLSRYLITQVIFARNLWKTIKTTLWLPVLLNDLLTSLNILETSFGKFPKFQVYYRGKIQIYFFCTRKKWYQINCYKQQGHHSSNSLANCCRTKHKVVKNQIPSGW